MPYAPKWDKRKRERKGERNKEISLNSINRLGLVVET
jgi:hypothetical protein